MKLKYLAVGFVSLLFTTAGINLAIAKGSELKFHSSVIAISQSDGDDGSIDVMIHDIVVPVIVNGDTEIGESGEEITLADLSVGDFVRVNAFFSDDGLVADEIEVLDVRHEQFRFRGEITAVMPGDEMTVVTMLGVDVIVDDETDITRRGTDDGNDVAPADLMVGDLANVSGGVRDDMLVAHRMHVGTREQGNIELEGTVIEFSDTQLTMELEGGSSVTVVFDDASSVVGDLAEGVFVEVEGQLQEDLSLLAFEVVADSDGDGDADDDHERGKRGDRHSNIGRCKPDMPQADEEFCDKFDFPHDKGERGDKNDDAKEEEEDEEEEHDDDADEDGDMKDEEDDEMDEEEDDDRDPNDEVLDKDVTDDDNDVDVVEVGAETLLSSDENEAEGFAEFHYEMEGDFVGQELELVVEGVEPGSAFEVVVYFGDMVVSFGMVQSNDDGVIRAEFESHSDEEGEAIDAFLPEGMDVRDITGVQVLQGDSVVVGGDFDL